VGETFSITTGAFEPPRRGSAVLNEATFADMEILLKEIEAALGELLGIRDKRKTRIIESRQARMNMTSRLKRNFIISETIRNDMSNDKCKGKSNNQMTRLN
jgi:hypothetical protein